MIDSLDQITAETKAKFFENVGFAVTKPIRMDGIWKFVAIEMEE